MLGAQALLGAGGSDYDSNAQAYIAAVEAIDGQSLETGVKNAINAFVVGCKSDGIWNALKASCILAGARTLEGCLVPVVGTAPVRQGTSGGWNYNRKTGLAGNGTDNYINSSRSYTADPLNSFHLAAYVQTVATSGTKMYIGAQGSNSDCVNDIYRANADLTFRNRGDSNNSTSYGTNTGFVGSSRSNASNFLIRVSGTNPLRTITSVALSESQNVYVFARNLNGTPNLFSDGRLSFYSIGESLDLALLDSRVTTLVNAIAAAIP